MYINQHRPENDVLREMNIGNQSRFHDKLCLQDGSNGESHMRIPNFFDVISSDKKPLQSGMNDKHFQCKVRQAHNSLQQDSTCGPVGLDQKAFIQRIVCPPCSHCPGVGSHYAQVNTL